MVSSTSTIAATTPCHGSGEQRVPEQPDRHVDRRPQRRRGQVHHREPVPAGTRPVRPPAAPAPARPESAGRSAAPDLVVGQPLPQRVERRVRRAASRPAWPAAHRRPGRRRTRSGRRRTRRRHQRSVRRPARSGCCGRRAPRPADTAAPVGSDRQHRADQDRTGEQRTGTRGRTRRHRVMADHLSRLPRHQHLHLHRGVQPRPSPPRTGPPAAGTARASASRSRSARTCRSAPVRRTRRRPAEPPRRPGPDPGAPAPERRSPAADRDQRQVDRTHLGRHVVVQVGVAGEPDARRALRPGTRGPGRGTATRAAAGRRGAP